MKFLEIFNISFVFFLISVLVSHLKSEAHADIQESELVLFQCDVYVHEIEVDAQGGVVAGNMKIKNTEVNGELIANTCSIYDLCALKCSYTMYTFALGEKIFCKIKCK